MARWLGSTLILGSLLLASGCSLCCAPYDCNYTYTGGRWIRDNPAHGRVGSAFEPAGTRVEGDALIQGEAVLPQAIPVQAGPPSVMQGRSDAGLLPAE